jgi:hypothetical protein
MARQIFKHCSICQQIVLVYGEAKKGDVLCPHKSRGREPIAPTVYYENKNGQRLYPWDRRELPKKYTDQGYQRIELNGLGDVRRFERETGRQLQAEHSQRAEEEAMINEYQRDRRHASLRQDMGQMDSFMKEVAQLAIDNESKGRSQRYDPQFYIEAYS